MSTNPYQSPRAAITGQADLRLQKKARLILARRDVASGIWFYFKHSWKQQVFFVLLCVLGPVYIWWLGLPTMAIALACFAVGAKLRDIRWWWALAREWPDTQQLLDWEKITAIANAPDGGKL